MQYLGCEREQIRDNYWLGTIIGGEFLGFRYYFDDFEVMNDPANPDSYPIAPGRRW